MKVEAKLFEWLTVFIVGAAIVYGTLAHFFVGGRSGSGIEWAGLAAMVLTAGLTFIIGTYLRFVSRRIELRPEDFEEAEVSDGAGDLGFFSPFSFWPVTLAAAIAVVGIAASFWQPWMIGVGVVCVLFAVGGLVFEYHLGPEKH